jgi:hypothetical protein
MPRKLERDLWLFLDNFEHRGDVFKAAVQAQVP